MIGVLRNNLFSWMGTPSTIHNLPTFDPEVVGFIVVVSGVVGSTVVVSDKY